MSVVLAICSFLGINPLRLFIYAGLFVAVVVGAVAIRQHYVNEGWRKHAAAVEKQDNRAVETNRKVEETAQKCTDTNGFWDVITQDCKLMQEEK